MKIGIPTVVRASTAFFGWLLILSFCSCGVETYRTFEPDISRSKLYSDKFIDCAVSAAIFDHRSSAEIYLKFTAKSDDTVEVVSIDGDLQWLQNGEVVNSLPLSSIYTGRFHDSRSVSDSTFERHQVITDPFRMIRGKRNSLLYSLQFSDSAFNSVPERVNQMRVYVGITTKSKTGITNLYRTTIRLDEDKHYYFWLFRDG